MSRIKKSKTNGLYFQDIPNPDAWRDEILSLMRQKYRLREQRKILIDQAREVRKRIYNYSQEIEGLQKKEDTIVLKFVLKGEDKNNEVVKNEI